MNAVLFSQLDVFSVDVVDSRSRYGGAPCAGEDKNRSKIANFDPPVFPDPAAGTDISNGTKKSRAVPSVCKVPSRLLRSDRGSEDQLLLQSDECLTWLFMESCTGRAPLPPPGPPPHAHTFKPRSLLLSRV